MSYYVDVKDGKRPSYFIRNTLTRAAIGNAFTNVMAANHIVMCLNLYDDLRDTKLLPEVLKMLDDAGR